MFEQMCIRDSLDFRGVQAWDAQTAIVMSSGKGRLSRLYKTTDGCKTWKLLFTNPESEGFYDALLFIDRQHGIVLGDPARGDPRINPVEGLSLIHIFTLHTIGSPRQVQMSLRLDF